MRNEVRHVGHLVSGHWDGSCMQPICNPRPTRNGLLINIFNKEKKIKSEMKFAFAITSFVSRAHRRWRIVIVPTWISIDWRHTRKSRGGNVSTLFGVGSISLPPRPSFFFDHYVLLPVINKRKWNSLFIIRQHMHPRLWRNWTFSSRILIEESGIRWDTFQFFFVERKRARKKNKKWKFRNEKNWNSI